MSDLSRLLDDVYEPPVKDDEKGWTSDEALDEAFSDWVPGPGEDATERERSLFADARTATTDESPAPLTDSIPAVPPAARDESAPDSFLPDAAGLVDDLSWSANAAAGEEVVAEPVPVAWRPEDDDILPKRGASRRLPNLTFKLRR